MLRDQCNTEYEQKCITEYREEVEYYTETECNTDYKQDCEYQWEGTGNNKVSIMEYSHWSSSVLILCSDWLESLFSYASSLMP